MRWFRGELPDSSFERLRAAIQNSSIKTRLMIGLIPPVLIILIVTGYLTYFISSKFIHSAIERSSQLQVMALNHEIEYFLDHCRQDLSNLAKGNLSEDALRRFLSLNKLTGGSDYLGIAFISQKTADHLIYMAKDGYIAQIPPAMISEIKPIPLIYYEKVKQLTPDQVWLSPITELEFPFPEPDNPNQKLIRKVINMATPCCMSGGATGYLIVMVDVLNLRNILSLYNSSQSPIWAFERTAEERYFYLFDLDGWILFQSEPVEKPHADLSSHLARTGFTGILGRQGQESAFLPDSIFRNYWKMVEDVRESRNSVLMLTTHKPNYYDRDYFLAYAPVRFKSSDSAKPQVVAGVAYMDISRLTMAAGFKHMDTMFLVTIAAALVVAGLIYLLGGIITQPIVKLAQAVKDLSQQPELEAIHIPHFGREIKGLQQAINTMIATLSRQVGEIRQKDRKIRSAILKEQALLDRATTGPDPDENRDRVPSIVGYGARIEKLKSEILKAAQADADVLIIGETGTGKQLAAEAIHNLSARRGKAFISINCGALDENLLLDTLFGHVKGAFTEAKTDRKGAFMEADRGTLFLDEIQVASPRVQQAMLRAIAMRKVKPLGSDRETDVEVRLIVATNVDLKGLIDKGLFREDLYFRLKVITVHTPPLREQKENIPVLARHFLGLQERLTARAAKGLSKGALSMLMRYDWPGNVRELQNCLTRAGVMADGQLIQADDIHLDAEDGDEDRAEAFPEAAAVLPADTPPGLNARQRKVFAAIAAQGQVTRGQYQALIGGNLPARTAIYDLQDLAAKGILKKTGRGPATHYVLQKPHNVGSRP
jgi:DNA-binding NtrC family response regulator